MKCITTAALYDLEQSICGSFLKRYNYPWEILSDIGNMILELGRLLPEDIYECKGDGIWIATDASVADTACLNGPLIVDRNAQIRHGAFIRGNAVIGRQAVVGNSTELKNCILFNAAEVPHFNYIGDSILGFHAHMGAGAVTSNVKSDRTEVIIRMQEENGNRINLKTGRRKLGAMLGDYAEIGCSCVLNPGTVIGRNTAVYPLSSVRGYVPENCIYKKEGIVTKKERRKQFPFYVN